MLAYIPDGYTERGFIAAEEGKHPELRFEYRPLLHEQVVRIDGESARKNGSNEPAAKALAEQLVSWDVKDASGGEVKISSESLMRIRPPLFIKLYAIVAGYRASDHATKTGVEQVGESLKNSASG